MSTLADKIRQRDALDREIAEEQKQLDQWTITRLDEIHRGLYNLAAQREISIEERSRKNVSIIEIGNRVVVELAYPEPDYREGLIVRTDEGTIHFGMYFVPAAVIVALVMVLLDTIEPGAST